MVPYSTMILVAAVRAADRECVDIHPCGAVVGAFLKLVFIGRVRERKSIQKHIHSPQLRKFVPRWR